MALLIQLTANLNRDPDQQREPWTIEEVLGWLGHAVPDAPPVPPEQAQVQAKLAMLAEYYNSHRENGQRSR
jgi:hypothetical protein